MIFNENHAHSSHEWIRGFSLAKLIKASFTLQAQDICLEAHRSEAEKMAMADSLMDIAVKRYKDVYYVQSTSAAAKEYTATVDGTHPDDYGYYLWYRSVKKPILRILRKYGIQ